MGREQFEPRCRLIDLCAAKSLENNSALGALGASKGWSVLQGVARRGSRRSKTNSSTDRQKRFPIQEAT